ncbi:homoserine kinase [Bacillus sp. 1P06AnD]|uniref:homoserine kinase n=1 Tax=Bacillus sp. 1P06AnD TaxID=3132208 RepID=UPI0039A22755
MNDDMMFSIRVPASTANLGPGFDSIGLALSLYLTVDVYESERWEVEPLSDEMEIFPRDDTHFIIQIAKKTAERYGKELHPCSLQISSEIPLARGLGSSASAIVAGIQLADILGGLQLSVEEKVHLASLEEGHPDNAGASVTGGLVVGLHEQENTRLLSFSLQNVEVVAVIPSYELLTKESRSVLPEKLPYKDAVKASAVANTFLAALLSGNYTAAGEMMKQDLFHQPYRRPLVPLLGQVEEIAGKAGAFGTALSGAGPSIVALAEKECIPELLEVLRAGLPDCKVLHLPIDEGGCVVLYDNEKVESL